MVRVFLTPPFDAPEVLVALCGACGATPATLEGFAAGIGGWGLPWLVPDPGGQAAGHIVEADQEALMRLTHVTQVLGVPWRRADQQDGPVTLFADDVAGTQATRPVADLAAMITAAAPEILGYRGRLSMPDIAQRRQMILSRAWAQAIARAPAATELRSARGRDTVSVSACDTSHEGYFLTRTYHLRHPVLDGGMSALVAREVFVATDAALVLPYDPAADRVLLVEQVRMGPFGRGDPAPWVLEPVAGRVDPGETPQECARRECLEEAHLALDQLEHMSSHYCSPGCSTEFFHCFLGVCDLSGRDEAAPPGRGGLASEHEDIATHVIGFDRAQALMQSGEINIGPLFLMLLWLERERPRLRATA